MGIIVQMSETRKILNTEVNELLKQFLNRKIDEKFNTFYTGRVVDNNDPEKLGRCKINVFGIYDEIPESDLPWSIPDFNFIGSTLGNFIVPPNGAIVKVYFDHGDIYLPRYTTKVVENGKLPSDINEDYPNTMVFFETDDGDKLTINRKTGKIKFTHRSKTEINIDENGSYSVNHKSGSSFTIDNFGNIKIDHKGFLEDTGVAVIPDPTGGPFCALPFDTLTGAPLQGKRVVPGG